LYVSLSPDFPDTAVPFFRSKTGIII
jgi:hypothetical protein